MRRVSFHPPVSRRPIRALGGVAALLALTLSASAQPPFPLVGGAEAGRAGNPHGDVALSCETCHTATAWRPLRPDPAFDHAADAGFALEGRHAQASCASCHLGLRFTGLDDLGADCGTCHLDVHRGALGDACQSCHEPSDWALVEGVEVHAQTAFPLTGAHLQVSCETCHTGGAQGAAFTPLPAECVACHEDDLAATAAATVPHDGFPTDCATCHHTTAWASGPFDHTAASGGFALVGAHEPLACTTCHTTPDFGARFDAAGPNDCVGCHAEDAAAATPDHGGFPTTCTQCHSVEAWDGATADHTVLSGGFALTGQHLSLDCAACHTPDLEPIWEPASQNDCVTCHADDAASAAPDHDAFPETCATCHTTDGWPGATIDHPALADGFALEGAHAVAECAACHSEPDFEVPWDPESQTDCVACHADDYQATAGGPVDHVAAGFPTECAACHTTSQWAGAGFDHAAEADGFALVGAHGALACAACHSGADGALPWNPASQNDCVSCHADDAAAATPAHDAFPETCTTCHGVDAWGGATADHVTLSGGFALLGAHGALACATCHSEPDGSTPWAPTSQDDCVSCHASDAAQAEPDHDAFPETCASCHGVDGWEGATVDHPAVSGGFALLGVHLAIDCDACHSGPGGALPWTPASDADCVSCHADDAAEAEPDHTDFPETCATCHTVDDWDDAEVDHVTLSGGYALEGAHLAAECEACHANPDGTVPWTPASPTDCVACHAADYQSTAGGFVDHVATGFPDACADCHGVSQWAGTGFDHVAASGGFSLVGAHGALACATCHSEPGGGVPWAPASPDDCVSCHAGDAAGATPSHTGFPETCTACHSTDQWAGAAVDHPAVSGGFALVGAHMTLACETCHSGPGGEVPWAPASQDDCVSCHADDAATAQPDHTGFPTACLDCHTTDQWPGATFEHAGFPIYSGKHAGEWSSCQTCHVEPGDVGVFSCVTCHEHNQADTDDDHDEVGGYVYESTACYSCHPTGEDDVGGLGRPRRR